MLQLLLWECGGAVPTTSSHHFREAVQQEQRALTDSVKRAALLTLVQPFTTTFSVQYVISHSRQKQKQENIGMQTRVWLAAFLISLLAFRWEIQSFTFPQVQNEQLWRPTLTFSSQNVKISIGIWTLTFWFVGVCIALI